MSKTKWSKNPNARHRRRNALDRLESTLKHLQPHHTEKDKERMIKEIEILKTRI